jgi:hypothetical protein
MTARSTYDSLPDSLKIALAVAITEPEHANQGSDELRHLARHILLDAPLDTAVLDILNETLPTWLDQQSRLHAQADDVLARLYDADPVDIDHGVFPAWFVRPWAQTLGQAWAENLPEAIIDAEAHLSTLT